MNHNKMGGLSFGMDSDARSPEGEHNIIENANCVRGSSLQTNNKVNEFFLKGEHKFNGMNYNENI